MHQEFKSENWMGGVEREVQNSKQLLPSSCFAVYFDYVWVLFFLILQLSTFYFSYHRGLTLVFFILCFGSCFISFYVCYNRELKLVACFRKRELSCSRETRVRFLSTVWWRWLPAVASRGVLCDSIRKSPTALLP